LKTLAHLTSHPEDLGHAFDCAVERAERPPLSPGGVAALARASAVALRSGVRRARIHRFLFGGAAPMQGFDESPRPVIPGLCYVLDDDDGTREALCSLLRAFGAEVVAFSEELSLFAEAARRPPAVILLDVVLPWVDGLRLCAGIKNHPTTAGSRIFMMSGLGWPGLEELTRAAGAEQFFPKPLRSDAIVAALFGAEARPVARDVSDESAVA
jgi:PleD family two-component response regulator